MSLGHLNLTFCRLARQR